MCETEQPTGSTEENTVAGVPNTTEQFTETPGEQGERWNKLLQRKIQWCVWLTNNSTSHHKEQPEPDDVVTKENLEVSSDPQYPETN